MVAKPRLGSVPSPSSHCCFGHSFGGRWFSYGATLFWIACTVYSFGGGVGFVVLADSRCQVFYILRLHVWDNQLPSLYYIQHSSSLLLSQPGNTRSGYKTLTLISAKQLPYTTACYPAGPSRASFNSDKVFQISKFDRGSRRGSLTWYFRSTSPKGDWVKKSARSIHKQKSFLFDPFRTLKTQNNSIAFSK